MAGSRGTARRTAGAPSAHAPKYVYAFANGRADGSSAMRALLGGKGCELAEMTNLGVPVPPGFTITTEAWAAYNAAGKKHPAGLWKQVLAHLARLEAAAGSRLGDPARPLLVSVRSGARASMPGMMDTVLNLGLNDRSVQGLARTDQATSASRGTAIAASSPCSETWCCPSTGRPRRAAGRGQGPGEGADRRRPARRRAPGSRLRVEGGGAREDRHGRSRRIRSSSCAWPSTRSSTPGGPRRRSTTGASTGCPTTGAPR